MIQNELERQLIPVHYKTYDKAAKKETLHSTRYLGDLPDNAMIDHRGSFEDRNVFVGTSVPYESSWIHQKKEETKDIVGLLNSMKIKQNPVVNLLMFNDLGKMPKITDIVEVVGIYYEGKEVESMEVENDKPKDKPENNIPKKKGPPEIHVLSMKNGSMFHNEVDCLKSKNEEETAKETMKSYQSKLGELRKGLIGYISQWIGGNALVAEYIFAQLCCTVKLLKKEYNIEFKQGKFSINIQGISQELGELFCARLSTCLKTLVPRVQLINLTTSELETKRFDPVQDNNTGMLSQGRLQCAKQTNVIINQTVLSTGKLKDTGVRNWKSLNELVTKQKLQYGFAYGQIPPFNVDMPVIIVSTKTSVFKTDTAICLKNLNEKILTNAPNVTAEKLEIWRKYIAYARQT
eukprot:UN02118